MTPCPDDDMLIALVEHALPPDRVGAIEAHVDGCPACRQVIASLAHGVTLAVGSTPRAEGTVDLERGTLVGQHYRIERPIGRGGMGTVYLARDVALGRDVAVKIHRAPAGRERLYKEAVAMARLAHPNVVNVFEIGIVADRRFVAMEYVSGGTSREWLATPRTWREIVGLFAEAGEGIAAAHRAGLVHRDFKPENVLVGDDGRPRVSDFGLVQEHGDSSPAVGDVPALAPLTETGAVVGTPAYMAPEQLAGGEVDGRCDQFSFCVSVWEALYGVRPFAGATTSEIQAAIERGELRPAARRDVPHRIRRVLERGLAARADRRFAEMPALLAALRRAARPRTRRWIAMTVLAATAVVAGGLALRDLVHVRNHARACTAAGDAVRALLGPADRDQVTAAFAATGLPFAPAAAERALVPLGRYAQTLADRTTAACNADEPAPIAAARTRCLRTKTAVLAQLVRALQRGDARVASSAPDAAWAISDPAPCDDPRALLTDESQALPVEDEGSLAEARAALLTGDYAAGIAKVEPMVAAAKQRGDRHEQLAAIHLLTQLRSEIGPADQLRTDLDAEVALAEELGDDVAICGVHATLAEIAAQDDRAFPQAHRELELARAKLRRLGSSNRLLEAKLATVEGQILAEEERLGDAAAVLRHGADLLEQTYGGDHPQLAVALGSLAQVLLGAGKVPEALAAADRALAIFQGAYGDHHPMVAGTLQTRAQCLLALERFDDAHRDLDRADAIFLRVMGEDHPTRAGVASILGQVALAQQHPTEALAAFRRELAITEKVEGSASGHAASVHGELAAALAAAGRLDDAVVEARTHLAISEHVLAKDDIELGAPLDGLIRRLLAVHRSSEALPLAERALALVRGQAGVDPAQLSGVLLLAADAYWDHGDRARARSLAGQASDHDASAAWLADHR